jgi:hypothetical protein
MNRILENPSNSLRCTFPNARDQRQKAIKEEDHTDVFRLLLPACRHKVIDSSCQVHRPAHPVRHRLRDEPEILAAAPAESRVILGVLGPTMRTVHNLDLFPVVNKYVVAILFVSFAKLNERL